ncbi:YadA C-terminal domain-containing protein [Acinetobacter indicus]|uniref:YadA C-terminal domain-containing protein n=1 Tax=Acinetobacter indicus TaxID=756892 RepID=UPI001D17208D|nr:YadA C-terminal domain-containing protein [Acinetobacter indicus]
MKFQKTLLAAALAMSVVSVSAFAAPIPGEALVNQYYVLDDDGNSTGDFLYEIGGKVYERVPSVDVTGQFDFIEKAGVDIADATKYQFHRGGMVETLTTLPNVGVPTPDVNVEGGNANWSYSNSSTIVTSGGSVDYIGQVTDELGNKNDIDGNLATQPDTQITESKVQYMENGHFHGSNGHNVGVYTAQVDTNDADDKKIYQASALNAQGLTLIKPINLNALDEDSELEVDYLTGTTTIVTTKAGTTIDRTPLEAYGTISRDEDGNEIGRTVKAVKFNGEYYTVSGENNDILTKADASVTEGLVTVAGGAAVGKFDAETTKASTTAFVGSTATKYGEKTETFNEASTITVGSTDTSTVLQAGKDFNVGTGSTTPKSTTEKYVTTGIIKTDAQNNNTYGLTVVESKDGKTNFTEVTAEGVVTTGDVTIFANSDKETTVGKFVESAAAAVDAKVDAALVEVDSRLQQFNGTAARLNSRIDDVEKTSYRGIAIALAAQQQIPNIGAGQFAVFGGVGHYEGETAGALGVASVFADGRTSVSAALGVAGSNEVGGRVGVSYVFGGK